jgi:hypothetical protein
MEFEAPGEGLYAFYLVAANESGPSGEAPTGDTEPLRWAFIDYTPPILQVHPLRIETGAAHARRILVHWSAIDDHLVAVQHVAGLVPRAQALGYG